MRRLAAPHSDTYCTLVVDGSAAGLLHRKYQERTPMADTATTPPTLAPMMMGRELPEELAATEGEEEGLDPVEEEAVLEGVREGVGVPLSERVEVREGVGRGAGHALVRPAAMDPGPDKLDWQRCTPVFAL